MSDPSQKPGDLNAIKPPAHAPPTQPDPNTAAEEKVYKRSPTPTEREAESHRAHIESLNIRITHHVEEYHRAAADHKSECDRLRAEGRAERDRMAAEHKGQCDIFEREIDELQKELAAKQARIEELIEEGTELRTVAKSTGCLTLIVTAMVGAGGGAVGFAGGVPDLPEEVKKGLVYGGSSAVLCGIFVAAATWLLTPSSRTRRRAVIPTALNTSERTASTPRASP